MKGGFARCYELVDMDTNKIYAGKIVAKSLLTKSHQKEKVRFANMYKKIYPQTAHVSCDYFDLCLF